MACCMFVISQEVTAGLGSSHHRDRAAALNMGLGASVDSSITDGRSPMWESGVHILYGTAWKKEHTARLVEEAVTAGFRYIDTACQPKHYNEAGVGEGWTSAAKKLGLDRSEIYLQTKFTPIDGQDPNRVPYDRTASLEIQVEQSLVRSLENLKTDYLDALVLHSPLRNYERTLEVWRKFETFVDSGKVKVLGISNCYDFNTFVNLYNQARHKPKVLQNRFYSDSHFDVNLRNFCRENGIKYQSFWTLTANRSALATKEAHVLAQSKGLSTATLMYAFMMALGHTPLSGTTNGQHMHEDVDVMERIVNGEKFFGEEEMNYMSNLLGISQYM